MDIAGYFTADIVADQLADGGGKIEIDGVDIFCYESVLQGPVGGLSYGVCLFVQAEVIQQHGCGEDAAQGVGDVFAGGLGIGAVDGFEEGGALADGGGGQQSQGTTDDTGLVAEDVTEHIFRQDHVELFGIQDDLHGGIVHEEEVHLYIAVLTCDV